MSSYISVELSNEAGEVAVFEVFREQSSRELIRVPNYEAIATSTPRDHCIR